MRSRDTAGTPLLPRSSPGDGERHAGQSAQDHGLAGAPAPAILVIAGPTGTGKSALAVEVAARIRGEIVGCDALQVYRGFDAATAKPNPADRLRAPHWLVDVADPRVAYTVADYVRDADAAIAAIRGRGNVPVIVGGAGMYLRGLLKGLVEAPLPDAVLRVRLRRMADRFGTPRLHRLLTRLDPASAGRLRPEDTQRVTRALELALPSDTTWSARLEREGTWARPGERYTALKFGLDCDRELLGARLAARVDAFFAADLPGEVERLLAAGVPETANAFRGIGYREILRARAAGQDPGTTREEIVAATRRYAKRQRTWFRGEPGIMWLDGALGVETLASTIVGAWRGASAVNA